jgi:nitroreductase/NAD-dependent dihydropyrimidine dehydrogenase PreA subunit
MAQAVATVIDREKCVGCGQCVRVCPSRTLALVEGKAAVVGDRSLQCGHCQAVCPTGAARVTSLDPDMSAFASFSADTRWLAPGQADPAQLLRLMGSRRSCRNYQDRAVPRDLLLDLVKAGVSAPSGTNCQAWTFTILPTRADVLGLAQGVGDFFAELNRLAGRAWLRRGLALLGRGELARYHREHAQSVGEALAEWRATGRERLFHGATAAIIVGSAPGASCPAEDALLASGHILLAAHALGLGACLVGFVVEALRRRPDLARQAGLAAGETAHAVIALGWPDESYARVAGRKTPLIRLMGGGE